ncbi:MAG TPA: hypothetical protein VJB16_05420, partial [archaeon]|nr:hypothetical protein [archaeon]
QSESRFAQSEKKLQDLEDRYRAMVQELAQIEERKRDAVAEGQRLQNGLTRMLEKLAQLPDDAELEQQHRDGNEELSRYRGEGARLDEQVQAAIASIRSEIDNPLTQLQRELQELGSEKGRRLKAFTERYPRASDAIRFVTEAQRQGKFHAHVFGPLLLELTVTDERHARYIEHFIGVNLQQAFICQNEHDRDLLFHEFKSRGFHSQIVFPASEPPRNPGDIADYAGSGIYTYLDEVFEADPWVRRALCLNVPMHMTLVGDEHTDRNIDAIMGRHPNIQMLVTPTVIRTVKGSAYDASVRTVKTEPLRPNRILSSSAAGDTTAALQQEVEKLQRQRQTRKAQLDQLQGDKKSADAAYSSLRNRLGDIQKQRASLKAHKSQIGNLRHELEQVSTQDFDR